MLFFIIKALKKKTVGKDLYFESTTSVANIFIRNHEISQIVDFFFPNQWISHHR